MRKIEIGNAAEKFISVKEAAHILRISPKTIYNKLWKGEFPLKTVQLPWNKRELFFHRSEVDDMAQMRVEPTRSSLRKMLKFIPEPLEPISVALYGSPLPGANTLSNRALNIKSISAQQLAGWWRERDILWIISQHSTILLARQSAEHYEAAALLCGAYAEYLREEQS